jgi:hypothetical protein
MSIFNEEDSVEKHEHRLFLFPADIDERLVKKAWPSLPAKSEFLQHE